MILVYCRTSVYIFFFKYMLINLNIKLYVKKANSPLTANFPHLPRAFPHLPQILFFENFRRLKMDNANFVDDNKQSTEIGSWEKCLCKKEKKKIRKFSARWRFEKPQNLRYLRNQLTELIDRGLI